MAGSINHIVQSIRVEALARQQPDAEAFNHAISHVSFETILDRALTGFEFPHERVKMDTIEVDAGLLDITDEFEMERQLQECIREALYNALHGYIPSQPSERFPIPDGQATGILSLKEEWEAFIHYLHQGYLPWYAANRLDIREFTLRQLSENRVSFFNDQRFASIGTVALQRMFHLLPSGFLEQAENLYPSGEIRFFASKVHYPFYKAWIQFSPGSATAFHNGVQLLFLRQLVTESPLNDVQGFLGTWIDLFRPFIKAESSSSIEKLSQFFKELQDSPAFRENRTTVVKIIEEAAEMIAHQQGALERPLLRVQVPGNREAREKMEPEAPGGLQVEISDQNNALQDPLEETEQWYVTHAGLVLLNAGMMSRCFHDFGWVQEGRIVNGDAANCMRLWLHYLVWENKPAAEYDLFLGKLLTGIPPGKPVPLSAPLEPYHFAEADAFLTAIIEHWATIEEYEYKGPQGRVFTKERCGKTGSCWLSVACRA